MTPSVELPDRTLHTSLFDVAVLLIGLSMTFWARRFAPIYFIFGAPVFLTWIVWLLRPAAARARLFWAASPEMARIGLMAGAGLGAVFVADEAWSKARDEIVRPLENQPQFNLLEQVTRYDMTPHNGILFLKENKLNVNLLVEWTHAGPVMFYAPNAKVFMDGRAQQVYDEDHYKKYAWLLASPGTPPRYMVRLLDEHGTDSILIRQTKKSESLWRALDQSGQWVPVLLGVDYGLFLRKDSRGLAQLGELLRRGEERRPQTAPALAARGLVWEATTPPDLEQALACWQGALRQDVLRQNLLAGALCFRGITRALLELGRAPEARQFVEESYRGLNQRMDGVSDAARRELRRMLTECWENIENATTTAPADQSGG